MKHWKIHALWFLGAILTVGLTYELGRQGTFSDAEQLIVIPSRDINVIDSAVLGKTLFMSGTWQIVGGEKDGFPKNFSQYRCDQRADGYCRVTEVRFYKNSFAVDTTDVKVTKWDDQQIILLESGPNNCRDFTVIVDLLSKEARGITSDTPNRPATCGEKASPLAEPRISKLIDGFDLSFPPEHKKS